MKCPRLLVEHFARIGAIPKPIVLERIKICGCDLDPDKTCAFGCLPNFQSFNPSTTTFPPMASSSLTQAEEATVISGGYYLKVDDMVGHQVPPDLADDLVAFEKEGGMDRLVELLGEEIEEDAPSDVISSYAAKLESFLDVLEVCVLQELPDASTVLAMVERRIDECQKLAIAKAIQEDLDDESGDDEVKE